MMKFSGYHYTQKLSFLECVQRISEKKLHKNGSTNRDNDQKINK